LSLFDRQAFEAHVAGLRATEIVRQWGDASVGKVGGRIFAILSDWDSDRPAISFKCSDLSFQLLPELQGVRPAPYLARAKWVQVQPGAALDEVEIAAYIEKAHRLVAARLTRRLRQDLGLEVEEGSP